MSTEQQARENKIQKVIPLIVMAAIIAYFVIGNWEVWKYIIVALIGFGAIVFIHELGHFIVARISGITIESFAIGFAIGTPFLFGIKRVRNGYRIRVLPKTSGEKDDPEGDCLHMFTIPSTCEEGECEYCIGPLPMGGFVKMLGQDDTKIVDTGDDPRSYANKSVGTRIAVVAAGVTFNIIGAFLIFTILSMMGYNRAPAVVGGVLPNSPAAEAGLQYGDEFIEIDGKEMKVAGHSNLDFSHIMRAAIMTEKGKAVQMKVRSVDGEVRDIEMTPEKTPGDAMPKFGIAQMDTTTFAEAKLFSQLPKGMPEKLKELGIEGGEKLIAVGDMPVNDSQDYDRIISELMKKVAPEFKILAKRYDPETETDDLVTINIPAVVGVASSLAEEGVELSNAATLVPRLKISSYSNPKKPKGLSALFAKFRKAKKVEAPLKAGDIVIKVANVDYPTFAELREKTKEYANKPLPITILRDSEKMMVDVTPYQADEDSEALIGIAVELEMNEPVIAKSVDTDSMDALQYLPAGAVITAVDGEAVSSFFDIVHKIQKFEGQRVPVEYYVDSKVNAGAVVIDIPEKGAVDMFSRMEVIMPFKSYEREYQFKNPFSAMKMGCLLMADMVEQSVVSIKMLLSKNKQFKTEDALTGPVGIAKMSYDIVSGDGIGKFVQFLGMISCILAVMNLLPIPVVDGGHIVLLIVEKIKGSPVTMLTQQILTYVGLALLGSLFIYATFNDIMKLLGF